MKTETEEMRGWTRQPRLGAFNREIWKCDVALCGAEVGVRSDDDRRRQHDREFHLLRAERGGGNGGYLLFLDGEQIGDAYDNVQHYNLRRHYVTHQWVARLDGRGGRTMQTLKGGSQFRKSMSEFVRQIDGAKAWGQGKNPSTWHFPDARR